MNDLISVILPIYNVEDYLERCVNSVISQSYKNLEIILVDDGSPDNCGKLCDEYAKKDNRIKVLHKQNGGLSDARNAGINAANGEYITFIDSDDFVEQNYIELLYNAVLEDKTDIAIGSHKVVYDTKAVYNKATNEESVIESKEALRRILYDQGVDLSAWAKLYNSELFTNVSFPKGRLFEDAATTYKLIGQTEKVSIRSQAIYNYMIRTDSITGQCFSARKMDLISSTKEMCDYCIEKYPDLKGAAQRRLMYAYLSTLSQLAKSSKKFPKEQKILMDYIKSNAGAVLKDKEVPKRDKLGIISARLGFNMYKFIWDLYSKVSGRG